MVAVQSIVSEEQVKYTDLHAITNSLVNTFIPKATSNKSFFVNEIPGQLRLDANPQLFSSILSGMFSAVVSLAKDSCIRLSAKTYGNVILIQVKESGGINITSVEDQLKKLQPLAIKLRGSVAVTSQRKKLTTITFGFPNYQQ